MNEATKTRARWTPDIHALLSGDGIDIGCGPDPVLPQVDRFDVEHGDANVITRYVHKQYDFVFSSHTLEHMQDPYAALKEWFALVKPGGHLIFLVPDEDLYEQGHAPSIFNPDHKATFTLHKEQSWSPRSVNVLDLVRSVPAQVVSVTLQDHGYDRRLYRHGSPPWGRRLGHLALRVGRRFPALGPRVYPVCHLLGAAIDQSALPDGRFAQIQVILRRPAESGGG
jgi:SAM-dependent methyltransferase